MFKRRDQTKKSKSRKRGKFVHLHSNAGAWICALYLRWDRKPELIQGPTPIFTPPAWAPAKQDSAPYLIRRSPSPGVCACTGAAGGKSRHNKQTGKPDSGSHKFGGCHSSHPPTTRHRPCRAENRSWVLNPIRTEVQKGTDPLRRRRALLGEREVMTQTEHTAGLHGRQGN